ncbi:hypothetical protein ASC55_07915 [Microbacterium sp. Root322]|nr:hypothetical protein ASC55_07915 [Microbacterium sp. Root322]
MNRRSPSEDASVVYRWRCSGLQIADMTARPIGLHVMRPEQPNRAWDLISTKLVRSSKGHIEGYGLKVYP